MTLQACAQIVERGDPDRFAAAMAAPPAARAKLLPLYALNIEVARAPWMTKEPMVAEMRLQWWRDAIEDAAKGRPRAHEIMAPLAQVIRDADLPPDTLDRLIDARRWDIYQDPFADEAALDAYLADTGGGLMWLAARALGAPDSAEPVAMQAGYAMALASFLRAVPELENRGRVPLLDGRPQGVAALANKGLAALAQARSNRNLVPAAARPAMLAAWQTKALLTQAARTPARVAEGTLQLSEFAKRGGLLWAGLTGRW
ncbi:MAG: squalene/phytoene synthase family protein [Paracoccaceae bacterium]